MKKKYFFVVFFCVFAVFQLFGQQVKKDFTVGDLIPDIEINNLINYSGTFNKISDLKGKALIIDFWATWCSSCVSLFPKIDSLQKKFNKNLLILPVTSQDREIASHLLNAVEKIKGIRLPSVVEDSAWAKLFKHKLLPHYIWIDPKGFVKAITNSDFLTEENIQDFIDGKDLNFPIKKDNIINYSPKSSLFASGLVEAKELLYHSMITKYRQDISAVSAVGKDHIVCINNSVMMLYQVAFGNLGFEFFNKKRVIVEGAMNLLDSAKIGILGESTKKLRRAIRPENSYCYELFIDSSFSREQKFEIMRQDLNRFFYSQGISGKIEKRKAKVMELIRTSDINKLDTKKGQPQDLYTMYSIKIINLPLSRFLAKFQAYFEQSEQFLFKDATGYKEKVDIEINCDLKDLGAVNKELEKYDLKFIQKEEDVNMLVITKK